MEVCVELSQIAKEMDVPKATLRYWITQKEHLKKLTAYKIRGYHNVLCVTEPEEFKRRYEELVENRKSAKTRREELRKHNNGLSWTRSAIVCYEHDCDCVMCPNWDIACRSAGEINGRPPMAHTVERILSIWGKPPKHLMELNDESI